MPSIPIVILSAHEDVEDKVLLLELGADDYVTKPSVQGIAGPCAASDATQGPSRRPLQTPQSRHPPRLLTFGDRIDLRPWRQNARAIARHDSAEFKLLRFFAQSPERVISREELLNEVWLSELSFHPHVDNHICVSGRNLSWTQQPTFLPDDPWGGLQVVPGLWAGKKVSPGREIFMARLRLQTQLLISSLLIICALTGDSPDSPANCPSQIAEQVRERRPRRSRVESVQQKLQVQLSKTAALLAELPTLKALMTSRDAPTIQDDRCHSGSWQQRPVSPYGPRGKSWDFMLRERIGRKQPAINCDPWEGRIRPGGLQAVALLVFSVPSRRMEATRATCLVALGMKSIPRLRPARTRRRQQNRIAAGSQVLASTFCAQGRERAAATDLRAAS